MMSTDPLAVFVGHWASSGRTVARPGEPSVDIAGTDDYEWLPGGQFLIHRVDVRMGGDQVDVLEVIGETDASGGWLMRAFDGGGGTPTMRATVDEHGVWTFAGPTERATVTLAADGRSMVARWERSSEGTTWEHWMDMEFARVSG